MARAGSRPEGVELGFVRVLGRGPSKTEATLLELALERYRRAYSGREADAEALLSIGERGPGPADDAAEQAAWTLVASTLLNMDEAVTRQ